MIRAGFILCVVLLLCGTTDARRKKSIETPPAEAATPSAPSDGKRADPTPATTAAPALPSGAMPSPPAQSADEPQKPRPTELDHAVKQPRCQSGPAAKPDKLMLVYGDPPRLMPGRVRRAKRPRTKEPNDALATTRRQGTWYARLDTLELQQRGSRSASSRQRKSRPRPASEQERSRPIYKRRCFGADRRLGVAGSRAPAAGVIGGAASGCQSRHPEVAPPFGKEVSQLSYEAGFYRGDPAIGGPGAGRDGPEYKLL